MSPAGRVAAAALALMALGAAPKPGAAQDHEREALKAVETRATLDFGEALTIRQANGHDFLALWLPAAQPRGVAIVAHGRGWSPDVHLYGALRVRLADAGWSTLSIQLPVLAPAASKLGDYLSTYPDAIERFSLAVGWVKARHPELPLAIVSHSLGATMANQYLIRARDRQVAAWVFLSIINGLEDMFRLDMPVLDVYADGDWSVTQIGAEERAQQIRRIAGSRQVRITGTGHFYDGRRDELVRVIVDFLDAATRRR